MRPRLFAGSITILQLHHSPKGYPATSASPDISGDKPGDNAAVDEPLPAATRELIESIVDLEADSGLSTRGVDGYRAIVEDPHCIVLAAIVTPKSSPAQRQLVGCFSARIVVDELQIDNVAVDMLWRGQGIGSELIATSLAIARRKGCLTATLEVRSANLPAQQLYYKFGFQLEGRRPAYYHHPTDDALVMNSRL